MSDLFHDEVPFPFIAKVFKLMNNTSQITYQVLTKRADRLYELHDRLNWQKIFGMGKSVENEKVVDRIDFSRETNAVVKFLSCEPLIGPLRVTNLANIDWVIVGGESARIARPTEEKWVGMSTNNVVMLMSLFSSSNEAGLIKKNGSRSWWKNF